MKLEINYKKKTGKKIPNMWRLNNLILNDHELMKKSKEKLKITKRHEHSIHQNLWDTAKAVLRGKFISIQIYLKKQEHSKTKKFNFISKRTRKRRTKEAQSQRNEESNKDQRRNK